MSRIGRQQETLAQVVDRLEGAVAQLLQLAGTLDLTAGVSRPYAPISADAARSHGATLALALEGDELRRAVADRYGHDATLLVAALDGTGLTVVAPGAASEPVLALTESAERLRALRSELRASERAARVTWSRAPMPVARNADSCKP